MWRRSEWMFQSSRKRDKGDNRESREKGGGELPWRTAQRNRKPGSVHNIRSEQKTEKGKLVIRSFAVRDTVSMSFPAERVGWLWESWSAGTRVNRVLSCLSGWSMDPTCATGCWKNLCYRMTRMSHNALNLFEKIWVPHFNAPTFNRDHYERPMLMF